ncbi:hypothetical protein ABT340_41310 [Streptosporangium sp. NPDC000239]|uniref:hypothetical protein n=1 Tax=Streptosporangium sp. NPDC000239 TaxID=3154248 RepID=UPI003318D4FE
MNAKSTALKVAAAKVLTDIVTAGYEGVRADAEQAFGAARRDTGAKTLDVALPDGTSLGTISILAGPVERKVNASAVAAVVAQSENLVEELHPEALADPMLIEFVRDHMPHLLVSKLPDHALKAAYKAIDKDGCLTSPDGEKVKVAEITQGEVTGKFAYRPSKDAEAAIRKAWEQGDLQNLFTDLIRPALEAGKS